jgi:hypothetical protein
MPDNSRVSATIFLASLIFTMLSGGKSLIQMYRSFSRRGRGAYYQRSTEQGDGTSILDSGDFHAFV